MILNFRHALLKATVPLLFTLLITSLPAALAQEVFHVNNDLYSETANPTADIAAAVASARHISYSWAKAGQKQSHAG